MSYSIDYNQFENPKELQLAGAPEFETFYYIRHFDGRNNYPVTFASLNIKGLEKEEFINASHCRETNALLFETRDYAEAAFLMLKMMGRIKA